MKLNNIGIEKLIKLVDSTAEDYKEIMDTNVFSSFIFSKYAVKDKLKRKERRNDCIYFFSYWPYWIWGWNHNTMTKFSQRGLSPTIDKELRSQGIKTCIMCLSATKFDFEIGFGTTKEGVVKTIWETSDDVIEGILYVYTAKNKILEIWMK